jgi:hypothetical protein
MSCLPGNGQAGFPITVPTTAIQSAVANIRQGVCTVAGISAHN